MQRGRPDQARNTGSGRRALVAALAPRLGDRLLLRFAFTPEDDGVGVSETHAG